MSLVIKQRFCSLTDCVAHVADIYAGEVAVEAKDRHTGESLGSISVPALLFRGESAQYPTTTATMKRISVDPGLSDRARQLMPKLAGHIESELRAFLAMSPMDSAGFAQHYGLPTELLDVTSDARVAGFFASGGEVGTSGYLAVFPTRRLAQSAQLIDLRNHASADRPRRQHAFAIFHRKYIDLKTSECVEELASDWFSFTLTEQDKGTLGNQTALLDAHTDPVAGALQLVIDSMVQEHGKLPDEIALWLSKKIAPAPFAAKVLKWKSPRQPEEAQLVSLAEAGILFDEEGERGRSYRYWSSKFSVRARSDA
jgi:FRG domain-containing protein